MDTEKILPASGLDLEKITILEYSDADFEMIQSFVEITRHIQELQQLYLVFRYNQRVLLSTYDLNNSDRIKRNRPHFENFDDRTELNALVVSLISAGKTLIDSITTCVQTSAKKPEISASFKKFLSQTYDGSFSYRLLTRLRDFSQHGHLPVSVDEGRVCFDIAQIMNTPHFNHNKSLRQEMQRFVDELIVMNKTRPLHVFTFAMAEYTVLVYKVYTEFYACLEPIFSEINSGFRRLILQYPESIKHENADFDGYLFYVIDNTLHLLNTADDPMLMFKTYKCEAIRNYDDEQQKFHSLQSSVQFKCLPLSKD